MVQDLNHSENHNQKKYLQRIDFLLKELHDLEEHAYTIIRGNNNILDLIHHANLKEFCIMFCPNCQQLRNVIVEGCDGALFFICDNCDDIIIELFRKE